ncbi:hypothetical protein J3B02_006249 [Coemansia erecta]|uniref:Large ribosomal subunit protein mL67 n=1 Tax=Coemansia asiatica TaxID=1052880 RepID=A0A9W7XL95_9FUNG|nr:hypothetical protein LPJ64_001448 [Coemansia asiatica]KAJ2840341.1 hypothetical protein J3B02_006249 [Coemansia erecta]
MSRGIYLFRNIRTKQVLATTEKSLLSRPKLIKGQIPDPTLRPKAIRPDHWTPLVVATGFESEVSQNKIYLLASNPGHPLVPKTFKEKREYVLMRNKNKRLVDLDTTEKQVAQLARTFVYLDSMKSDAIPANNKVKLLWQDKEWVKKVEDAGLQWPSWIEHGELDLKRGNIILNPEVRTASS